MDGQLGILDFQPETPDAYSICTQVVLLFLLQSDDAHVNEYKDEEASKRMDDCRPANVREPAAIAIVLRHFFLFPFCSVHFRFLFRFLFLHYFVTECVALVVVPSKTECHSKMLESNLFIFLMFF